MTRDELWEAALERCAIAIMRTTKHIALYLSKDGLPTTRPQDAYQVGVYTQQATFAQLREDMVEAECERVRRHG